MGKKTGKPVEPKKTLSPEETFSRLTKIYDDQINDQMGHLYNKFVTYISESKIPVAMVIVVLEILLQEALARAKEGYMGK
jgi:hypothetical protein